MANKLNLGESRDSVQEVTKVSEVRRENLSFVWTINKFGEFMDRKYEFLSPVFSRDVMSGTLKWRMVVFPKDTYPKGTCVAFSLLKVSDDDRSSSVIYTISFADANGKHNQLKSREKLFRSCLDFDECILISNTEIKEKCLLQNKALTIICELDLLVCDNRNDEVCKSYENPDDVIAQSSLSVEKLNISPVIESSNDLSSSKYCKRSLDSEKDINTFLEKKDNLPQSFPAENKHTRYDSTYCENKSLEILSDDLESLYSDAYQQDITIWVDDGKCKAHKLILTCRSEYFKQALLSQCSNEIHIPRMNTTTLDAVLFYLYTAKLQQITDYIAMDLLKACNFLNLPQLQERTQAFLQSVISVNNVIDIFQISKELKIDTLKHYALKFVAENHDNVSKTHQWNQMMTNDPRSAGEVFLTIAAFKDRLTSNGF